MSSRDFNDIFLVPVIFREEVGAGWIKLSKSIYINKELLCINYIGPSYMHVAVIRGRKVLIVNVYFPSAFYIYW